ncbi:hypothetical protein L6R49_23690 [Myxococcota bacterium]|nr:hypothetical protein [Myxococcota bacterium]
MSLFFLLLSCHHGRVTSPPPPPAQPWAALRWEPVGRSPSWSVVGLDLDALEATARAARAMLAARTVEGLGDFPVILGRETVGWDSRRCLSTALPMAGHGECALAPYTLALTDAVWLYHPRWGSAVRPIVRGSAHDLTELPPLPWTPAIRRVRMVHQGAEHVRAKED